MPKNRAQRSPAQAAALATGLAAILHEGHFASPAAPRTSSPPGSGAGAEFVMVDAQDLATPRAGAASSAMQERLEQAEGELQRATAAWRAERAELESRLQRAEEEIKHKEALLSMAAVAAPAPASAPPLGAAVIARANALLQLQKKMHAAEARATLAAAFAGSAQVGAAAAPPTRALLVPSPPAPALAPPSPSAPMAGRLERLEALVSALESRAAQAEAALPARVAALEAQLGAAEEAARAAREQLGAAEGRASAAAPAPQPAAAPRAVDGGGGGLAGAAAALQLQLAEQMAVQRMRMLSLTQGIAARTATLPRTGGGAAAVAVAVAAPEAATRGGAGVWSGVAAEAASAALAEERERSQARVAELERRESEARLRAVLCESALKAALGGGAAGGPAAPASGDSAAAVQALRLADASYRLRMRLLAEGERQRIAGWSSGGSGAALPLPPQAAAGVREVGAAADSLGSIPLQTAPPASANVDGGIAEVQSLQVEFARARARSDIETREREAMVREKSLVLNASLGLRRGR